MFADDSQKDLCTVLSYMAGRTLSKEEIWKALGLRRSTYYDRLDKGTLITADNLCTVATNLGINRAELLTRYRLIDPEEVESLAEQISGQRPLPPGPSPVRAIDRVDRVLAGGDVASGVDARGVGDDHRQPTLT